ncbi:MAG: AlkA N-terminal domain-containing protein [Myxococcota bacterium]
MDDSQDATATATALDSERCYAAMREKDVRFDGRFFVGVKTTGIFCRPVCPAPLPKASNCSFWPSAAAAQGAGFRPCFRCRPESAPGTPAWRGTAASVSRALRLIEAGALDHGETVDALAARLGISARHLRRLFDVYLGATPRAVARMRRTLFAKQLIDETDLAMKEIAPSAGFSSQRRFNACVREVYGTSPSALRARRRGKPTHIGAEESRGAIEITLRYRPPFAWDALLVFFRLRAIPGVEQVTPDCYARTVRMPEGSGLIEVRNDVGRSCLRVSYWGKGLVGLIELQGKLRRVFDLDADAEAIDAHLAESRLLRGQIRAQPGYRVPGAYDGFETAVRGILGQQVSVKGATTISGRVASRFGDALGALGGRVHSALGAEERGLSHLFPTPSQLVEAPLEEVGLIRSRAATIRGLAKATLEDPLLLEPAESLDAGVERLTALPGIGPWTAHYVAMRVLRESDACPVSDLVLRQRISEPGAAPRPAKDVAQLLEPTRPFRAYAAMRVWALPESGGGQEK